MLIAYRDFVEESTVTNFDTGYAPGAPLQNVKDRRLGVIARKADTFGIGITCTFAEDKEIGICAILGHNFSSATTVDFTLKNSLGATIHTEYAISLLPYNLGAFPRHLFAILPQTYTGVRSIEIATSSFSIVPQMGRIWAGPVWTPQGKTTRADFAMATIDPSIVNTSVGGQVYVDYAARYRQLSCGIPFMIESEAIGTDDGLTTNLQDIVADVGRGGAIIVIPSTSTPQVIHKFGLYGHFNEPPTLTLADINQSMGRLYASSFDLVEDL